MTGGHELIAAGTVGTVDIATFQVSVFVLLLFLAAGAMAIIGAISWRNRDVTGSDGLLALVGGMILWAVSYALQIGSTTEATAIFWANVNHIAAAAVPVAWIVFALQYTGRGRLVTRYTVGALSVPGTVYVALVWTNQTHGLIRESRGLEAVEGTTLLLLDQTFGPAFWAHAAYGYALMAAGVVLFAQLLTWVPQVYRRQVWLLLIGALIAMVTNVAFHADVYAPQRLDLTAFSFVGTGALFAVAIYRYRLLDLTPVAREFVVDTLTEGVVVVDRSGRIVDYNPAAAEILGGGGEDAPAIGRRIAEVFPPYVAHDETGQAAGRGIGRTDGMERGRTVDGEADRTIDGKELVLAYTIAPLYDLGGDHIGRTVTIRDITETHVLRAELAAQLEDVIRSNAELAAFTGAVSHDLRGPARTTERYLARLATEDEGTLSAEQVELIEIARANATRMQRMIADLLEYSYVGADAATFEPVRLDRVVADARESLRFTIEEANATVIVSDLPTVYGVEHLLRRAFQNLIANAIEHADEPAPTVRIAGERDGTDHVVTVSDDGPGIDPAALEYVFELFYRADPAASSGTGMGLALCRKIIEEHDGSIEVDSVQGEGTAVTIRLPRTADGS
ncbi:sensor histidine kinase [Halorubrum vacuolatum]|uniref:histidine kinase n=1 Tax=Halorubrum vacuolatum TaxID=63740 RepID=A0A238VKW8_HALVU|nr:histidine kinase N-terminal 7TM domain-containing protein [Halorubrum vacuolatum]SNR34814.1 PAS/PAC sensor signal transduction histidine kinase [Halorubrum vacuolatum]